MTNTMAAMALDHLQPWADNAGRAGLTTWSDESAGLVTAAAPLELDEHAMRSMVATTLERLIAHLRGLAASPATDAARGRAVADTLAEPLPEGGTSFEALLTRLFEDIIPPSVNTAGPGYLGYIPGGGVFQAALADFIAKSVNRYVGYYYMSPAVVQLEWTVLRWFCDLVGYGPDAGGVLTSGGSMATLTAMIAARTTRLPEDFRHGVIYLTTQTHYSVAKAALLAGFPERCLRLVPVDATWRMEPTALQAAITADRAAGLVPFMVVATAGTTNTGAVDPLDTIADISEREGLWLHVDGAYGGFFMLTEAGRRTLAGIARADSITLDPHKGLCLPYGTGALLTRTLAALKATYSARAEYLPAMNEVEGEVDFCGLSPELSRDWRGLRVWLPLKMHGVGPFRDNLDEKLALARDVEAALRTMPHVEIVASPQLSVLAFRLNPPHRSPAELDDLNQRFLEAITHRKRILLSATRLNGRLALRVALLSFRTHVDRVRAGLDDIRAAAQEVLMDTDAPSTLHGLFEAQARATPDRVALLCGERRVTFGALNAAADHLATVLRARGLCAGGHVGIYMSRSVEAITAMFGVLKAGGVYVPIDLNAPPERQRFIVNDAELAFMVCADRWAEVRTLLDPERLVTINDHACRSLATRTTTREESHREAADRPIYLLYTSGSTGQPKGVLGLQSATLNRLAWMWRTFPFAAGEVYLHRTTLTFVDAAWEIFGPLLQGVPLVVLEAEGSGDPDAMAAAVRQHGVTRVTVVPAILDALVRRTHRIDALSSVRLWISSGERLQAPLLARMRAVFPQATLLNLYGSTEVTGDVTCASFAPGDALPLSDVPIGKPISQARLFVLDEQQQPVADGEDGELYVGGPVIARGYHRRPDEHAARFVMLPHLVNGPLFRTGDRVRRDAQGVLHYVGRNDRQVKIRGVRIELDEVEATLLTCAGPGVAGAVVTRARPRPDNAADPGRHVAAFVAPATVDVRALRQALAAQLPAALMPASITALDALPRLPNGKTDRQALQASSFDVLLAGRAARRAPAGSTLEELICSLWSQRLPSPPSALESDFHLLGGDSLDLVGFLAELGTILGRSLPNTAIPRPLTVAAMARAIERGAATTGVAPGIEIARLSRQHYDAVLALLVESFAIREPMAAALGAAPSDLLPFARALLARCAIEPFSYVARARDSGHVVGFCLGHDYAGAGLAFDPARQSPKVAPLFGLLEGLHRRYSAAAAPRAGEVFEIAATGAAVAADGYTIARVLERRACQDAKAHGFQRVVSVCTHAVTRYLALADQGMQLLAEVEYATFEHEGRQVFADAARHRGVALVEGRLS